VELLNNCTGGRNLEVFSLRNSVPEQHKTHCSTPFLKTSFALSSEIQSLGQDKEIRSNLGRETAQLGELSLEYIIYILKTEFNH